MPHLFNALVVTWQAETQSKLKPASWLGYCRKCHSEKAEWIFDMSTKDAIESVWDAANSMDGFRPRKIDSRTPNVVVIQVFTKAKWMDLVTLTFTPSGLKDKSCRTEVIGESTGMIPLCIPGACFLNVALFWFPFFDKDGKCGKTMEQLRHQAERDIKRPIGSRVVRYSLSNPKRKAKK